MSDFRAGDRRQWIQQAREQQAIAQQLEKAVADPQEQAVRLQLARVLSDG